MGFDGPLPICVLQGRRYLSYRSEPNCKPLERGIVPDEASKSTVPCFDPNEFRRQKLDYLLEAEVASMTGVAVKTLRNWRAASIGPCWTRFGRKIMYPISAIESYLEENLNATTSKERTVGIPIQNRRSGKGVSANRLGGHRTKQEKSRAA
jgi:hypothetical protein